MAKTRSRSAAEEKTDGKITKYIMQQTRSKSAAKEKADGKITKYIMQQTSSKSAGKEKSDGTITKYSQYRNSISYLLDAYNSIQEKLTGSHRNIMQQTPFKLFFKAIDEKRICSNRRKDQVLDNIITAYVPEKRGIKIGRECCQIRMTDIKLIFGIMDGNLKVDKYHGKKVKSEFADRVFPNAQNITAKMMKEKLVKLVDNEDTTAVVDTVRVLCLLMFQACFFTNTGQTIAWTYVKYVEDLDTLKHYDWSSAIYDTLIQSLEKKSKKPRTVLGCTSSLLYWMCEHDKTMKPRKEDDPIKHQNQEDTTSIQYSGIPRCTKWDLSTLNKFVNKATIMALPKQSVIWTELEPTPAELQLIPDLTKNPVGHDSDFEDDIPMQQLKLRIKLQPVAMHEQDKNAQFTDEPSEEDSLHITQLEEQQQNDTYHSEENADFMHEDPFEQNVQGMLEFRNKERDSIEKTLKERDDKAERLKAKVKRMKKKLRKLERKEHEISKQKEEIRRTEELNSELLVKLKKFEERENEMKSKIFSELEEVYKGVVDGLKKENAGLLASLTDALIKYHNLQKHVNEMRSRLEEFEQQMRKSGDEGTEEIRQLNTSLTEKVKHLEDENCTKEATISELNSTVTDLQNRLDVFEEMKKSYESKIEEQHTKIDALHTEIENAAVHAVTQQYGNTDAKQVQKSVKQSSRVKAIKERKRTARKDDDFVYPENKKRRTEILDLTNEAAIEDVQRMEKTVKVSLKKKKAGYTCGEKITEEAFQLLHTTLNNHGRLGEVWSDIESGTTITVHDMVKLLEGSFIADKVIDAFATILSINEEVRKEFHILPAATWAYCKKYEATGNYSNNFVDSMKPHLEEGKNILIPLCCPGVKNESYHWILLTFASGEEGEWHMYNSLASRKGAVDNFEKNALGIQKYLWKCFCPSGKLKAKKIKKVAKLPQQGSDTNDCAIYVMYYIYQIALNQPIDKKWNTDGVQDFKAFIVNSITSNKMNIAMLANITVNV